MNPIYAASTGKNVGINPGWNHFAKYTYAPAIARDGFLFFTGLTASAPGGGIMHPGDIVAQTDVILSRFGEILAAAGCSFADVVSTREFIVDPTGYAGTAEIRRKYFKDPFPAATGVIVAGLLRKGALIEIDAIAAIPK